MKGVAESPTGGRSEAEDVQLLADTCENAAAARYRRQQKLAELVADAVKRAEAMGRLEMTLRNGSPLPTTSQRVA